MAGRFVPLAGRAQPRFAGVKTFFRLPEADPADAFDVALIGVPFDGGVSYRPGARFGPTAVRELSALGRNFHMSREVDWVQRLDVADVGDCPTVPVSRERSYALIEETFGQLFGAGKRVIAVGGDHSCTLPILRAAAAMHGPLNFIHFDAHLDTYPAAWGEEYHHGAFARHAITEGLIRPGGYAMIGIRGPLAAAEDMAFAREHGIRVLSVDDVREAPMREVVAALPRFEDGPTYLSFDIDCLDPAYAPGTGTPVPGGLTTWEAQRLLRGLAIGNLIGGDVVELSPPFDQSGITALAAVDVMFELLTHMAAG
ncbi:MAG: agmatinase [Sphingomonadaceae bacterium]|nr:agmatinase [Sphingomonadaceae bacterium]